MDIERIRKDLLDDLNGAYFIGGYGGAMIEAHDIENMSPDEIIKLAAEQGLDLVGASHHTLDILQKE